MFHDRSHRLRSSSSSVKLISRLSNMNIGTWPLESDYLTRCYVQCQPRSSDENKRLFWTKAFLQTTTYDEQRYRQIASKASQRILHDEKKNGNSSSRRNLRRMSSIVAVSLSQTSTKSKGSSFESKENVKKFSKTKSSESRFSCYLNSNCSNQKQLKAKKQKRMTSHSKNNNNHHELTSNPSSRKEKILRLTLDYRKSLCRECSNLIDEAEGKISSNLLCSRCLNLIRSMDQNRGEKRIRLTKFEEEEVRRLIESMLEELQNHLGQTLTVSMRQMTQHLLSNVHCFYGHYQKEFEELTKRYRLVFLERFVDLMKRGAQTKTIRSRFQSSSRRKSIDHCLITRPPEKLRFCSVNNSSTIEKNQTDSVSLSTSSNHSITIDAGRIERQCSIPQEKSFTTDSNNKETSNDMSKNAVSSLLLDAYRFRETLNISDRESKIRQTNNIPKKLEL